MNTRRDMLSLYLTGGVTALALAGCTAQQVGDVEKQVAGIIQQVQAGVVAACTTAGKLVPTANTVFAVLSAILGSSSVALATATMVTQAIAQIVSVGCPTAPPAPAATAKGVNVEFY